MYDSHSIPSTGRTAFPPSLAREGLTLEGLCATQPTDKLAAGEVVFWEGDEASHVFYITEGCLRLYRILPDGRRAIMGFVFAGEMLGLSCQRTYRCTAEAVIPVRLRRLSRARLKALGETAEQLQPLLMARISEEMAAAQQHIVVLGQMAAEERVAHFLISAAYRTGTDQKKPVVVELPMTRQDIADYLGLTIETVCRVLSKFKRMGLIVTQGRHTVILRRMIDLRELAGKIDSDETAEINVAVKHLAVWPN